MLVHVGVARKFRHHRRSGGSSLREVRRENTWSSGRLIGESGRGWRVGAGDLQKNCRKS